MTSFVATFGFVVGAISGVPVGASTRVIAHWMPSLTTKSVGVTSAVITASSIATFMLMSKCKIKIDQRQSIDNMLILATFALSFGPSLMLGRMGANAGWRAAEYIIKNELWKLFM